MPSIDKKLKDELIKISVDKLLIGIILVLLGNFSANLVEKFKSERSFSVIQNYIDSTLDYLYAIEDKPANEEKVRRLAAKREKSRVSIRQIRDKLLEE